MLARREEGEDERVDVLTVPSTVTTTETAEALTTTTNPSSEQNSFTLPVLYDIEDSEAEDALVRLTATTYRKKDIHEGKEYEVDEEEKNAGAGLTPQRRGESQAGVGGHKERRKR